MKEETIGDIQYRSYRDGKREGFWNGAGFGAVATVLLVMVLICVAKLL